MLRALLARWRLCLAEKKKKASEKTSDKRDEKEPKMAKKKVKFSVTDGLKPVKGPTGQILLKLPLPLNLKSGSRTVSLGLSCDRPLLVVCGGKMNYFPPNSGLTATLSAEADELNYGSGETIATCFVLDNSDVELV